MEMEKELYKPRSFSACIHDAYIFFCNNFFRILTKTWLPSLVLSLLCAVFYSLGFSNLQSVFMNPLRSLTTILCFIIAFIFVSSWLLAKCSSLFTDKPLKNNYRKCCYANGMMILVTAIISIVSIIVYYVLVYTFLKGKDNIMTAIGNSLGITAIVFILFLLAALPYVYSFTKYLLGKEERIGHLFKQDYVTGFKHYGYLFATVSISLIIVTLLGTFMALPTIVLFIASESNSYGVLLGDTSALPYYFPILETATLFIMFFCVNYLSIWIFIVTCYTYGNIATYEKENQQIKHQLLQHG